MKIINCPKSCEMNDKYKKKIRDLENTKQKIMKKKKQITVFNKKNFTSSKRMHL